MSSCVRKGKTINTWEMAVSVRVEGRRGCGALDATITWADVVRDGSEQAAAPLAVLEAGTITSQGSHCEETNATTDRDGNIIQTAAEVSSERVMRSQEMLLKLVKKKAEPLVRQKIGVLLEELR